MVRRQGIFKKVSALFKNGQKKCPKKKSSDTFATSKIDDSLPLGL
jgi:hypothetical protein